MASSLFCWLVRLVPWRWPWWSWSFTPWPWPWGQGAGSPCPGAHSGPSSKTSWGTHWVAVTKTHPAWVRKGSNQDSMCRTNGKVFFVTKNCHSVNCILYRTLGALCDIFILDNLSPKKTSKLKQNFEEKCTNMRRTCVLRGEDVRYLSSSTIWS